MTKNSPAAATDAHIAIIGHITSDELLRNLSETEAANGFANRFLWVCVQRSKLLPEGGGGLDMAALVQGLKASLAFARRLGAASIRRDGDARMLWLSAYPQLSEGRPGMTGAILGRAEPQVMRLALIYALLDQSDVIQGVHLRAALEFWRYVERSVGWVFGQATGDRVADDILRVLRVSADGLTRTELTNHFGRHQPAERLSRALEALRRTGRVSVASESTGGRPLERWRWEKCEESEVSDGTASDNSLTSLSSQSEGTNEGAA